jgi:hypothetical protein
MRTALLTVGPVTRSRVAADSVEHALRIFLGGNVDSPLPTETEARDSSVRHSPILISWGPAREASANLAHRGYTHQHRLAVLPSRKSPRWLLPLTADGKSIHGFQLYAPFSAAARLAKAAVLQMNAIGWQGWARDRVLVASAKPLPIENLASRITGEKHLTFSLSLGTPGAFQKLAVQVMRNDGEILGYLKMPLTEAARDRLRGEATILQKLRTFPQLRDRVPDLLYAGNWNETYVVFQTPLAGKPGPVYFTKLHTEFLEALHSCKPEILPGTAVIQEVARKWEESVLHMGSSWQALGREALKAASHEMRRAEVRCGIQHGDFAPWNTRVHNGALYLFDWEGAAWSTPALWDRFHFLAQTESLLNTRHPGRNGSPDVRKQNRGSYILYLLHSAVKLSEESENSAGIDYRKVQLKKYVRSNTVTSAAD